MDYKKGVEAALNKYHSKQLNQGVTREPKRKNKTPEKDVQKAVFLVAKQLGFSLFIIESSTYDPILKKRGASKATVGFPDLVGNTLDGEVLYIELKAKDRRSALSEAQRVFLEARIHEGCFAVVVDSPDKLLQYWKGYKSQKSVDDQKAYLLDCLPQKRQVRGQRVDPELGF